MTAAVNFSYARKAEWWSDKVFYFVALASVALLCPLWPKVELILKELLIVAAVASVLVTVITRIYMTRGNSIQRATQLSNALGAGLESVPRSDYYNNSLAPSLSRLGLTTLENTYFTRAVLDCMLFRERIWTAVYSVLFLTLLIYRGSSLDLLILVSQTVFSTDLLIAWCQLERFRGRTEQVRTRLYDFFLNGVDVTGPNRTALVVAAFAEFECAKDEAARTLDTDDFTKINPIVSREWDEVKTLLKIPAT